MGRAHGQTLKVRRTSHPSNLPTTHLADATGEFSLYPVSQGAWHCSTRQAMNAQTRHFIHAIFLALGFVLMVGGIATGTNGAVVLRLCVAAASFGAWLRSRNA